jgi:hypothetical protein
MRLAQVEPKGSAHSTHAGDVGIPTQEVVDELGAQ